jgi:glycerol-3-phosphate dehydrogenase
VFSIIGGKLTTYRSLAEEVVDQVVKALPIRSEDSGLLRQCSTDTMPLPGCDTTDFQEFCDDFRAQSHLSKLTIEHLLRVYGIRAGLIADLIETDNSFGEVFDAETGAVAAELVFAFEAEFARTLSDCLLRRTMVGLNSSNALNSVEAAARIAGVHLGWPEKRQAAEIATYRQHVARAYNVDEISRINPSPPRRGEGSS